MMRGFRLCVVAGFLLGALVGFRSDASAISRCTLDSTSGMGFGKYNARSRKPLDSTGFISLSCVGVTPADSVLIHLSRSASGSFMPRVMVGPSPRFEYNLYIDAARTLVWGDGTAGTGEFRLRPPNNRSVSVPVYGRIAPRQDMIPGDYQDTIIVTLMY